MGPDDVQNTVAANGPIETHGPIEITGRRMGAGIPTYETTVAENRNYRTIGGYTPRQQSVAEQLGCVSKDDFDELEKKVTRLIEENVELRQQVSMLQGIVINLEGGVGELKQILRFRYVDNGNDR